MANTIAHPAKHLEPLKGGKIPIEILVRGKDAEQNNKHWDTIIEAMKAAGVSPILLAAIQQHLTRSRRKLEP